LHIKILYCYCHSKR